MIAIRAVLILVGIVLVVGLVEFIAIIVGGGIWMAANHRWDALSQRLRDRFVKSCWIAGVVVWLVYELSR